jgi:phosphatidylinositol glycan class B
VALPTLVLFISIDSFYYGELTFVPYNFLYKNLVENISGNKFGVSPATDYLIKTFPLVFNFMVIFVFAAIYNNIKESRQTKQFPSLLVIIIAYTFTFSMIPHKEDRFLMPILPFVFLILGDFIYK